MDSTLRLSNYHFRTSFQGSTLIPEKLEEADSFIEKTPDERIQRILGGYIEFIIDNIIRVSAPTAAICARAERFWEREERNAIIATIATGIFAALGWSIALTETGTAIVATILAAAGIALSTSLVTVITIATVGASIICLVSAFLIREASQELFGWQHQTQIIQQQGDDLPTRIAKARTELFTMVQEKQEIEDLNLAHPRIVSPREAHLLAVRLVQAKQPSWKSDAIEMRAKVLVQQDDTAEDLEMRREAFLNTLIVNARART